MKKILITGGAGFIGANLIRKLVGFSDYDIFVIEKNNTNLWRIKDVLSKIKIKYVNLEDFRRLSRVMNQIKPDFIFHLASYGVYPLFQSDLNRMISINIKGTINLINALKNQRITSLVNTSTCFVYKEKKSKLKENDLLDPLNYYAITKLASELLLKKIALVNNLPIINLRLFTPYGYYEDSQRLIPTVILNALRNKKIKLSSPNNIRDFFFIEDLVNLFLKIIKNKKISQYKGELFNIGSGRQYSVEEIVAIIENLLGKKLNVIYGEKGRYQELKSLVADIRKAKKLLGWKTGHDIKSGVAETIAWFKNNIKLYEK